jgi:CheY-like chemotaxis protein
MTSCCCRLTHPETSRSKNASGRGSGSIVEACLRGDPDSRGADILNWAEVREATASLASLDPTTSSAEFSHSTAYLLAKGLREQTYAVDVAGDGETALTRVATNDYDAVILDVMLPGKDGFAVCRTIRHSGSAVPILMVTAHDAIDARIEGLDCGADDYLINPFDFGELLARLRAVIRRGGCPRLPERFSVGSLTLETRSRQVRIHGIEVPQTAKETHCSRISSGEPATW